MKIKHLFLVLVLALACVGCKSVPAEVRAAHDASLVESSGAFAEAEDLIAKVRAVADELNNEYVEALYGRWVEHVTTLTQHRRVVAKYLAEKKENEVSGAYAVGDKLLADLALNFRDLSSHWEEIATHPNKEEVEEYLSFFERDIGRFRELERKFDEWIIQFPVKG